MSGRPVIDPEQVIKSELALKGEFNAVARFKADGSVRDVKWYGKDSVAKLAASLGDEFEMLYATFYAFASNCTHVNANTMAVVSNPDGVGVVCLAAYNFGLRFAFQCLDCLTSILRVRSELVQDFEALLIVLGTADTEMLSLSV